MAELVGQSTWRGGQFSPSVLDQFSLIALGQASALSLDEVRAMLSPGEDVPVDRAVCVLDHTKRLVCGSAPARG